MKFSEKLKQIRKELHLSQEQFAEKIGVSRQTVAKWEAGETMPDLLNCDALASLYDVSLDDFIHFNPKEEQMPIPPKGKHLFGTVKVVNGGKLFCPKKGERGFPYQSRRPFWWC